MQSSLKRHRQSDETTLHYGRPSKRITLQSPCPSNALKTNVDETISKAENEISMEVFAQKRCMHKLVTSCYLSYTPCCCACVDIRPNAESYWGYIDGYGDDCILPRWHNYCPGCKLYWREQTKVGENSLNRLACSPSAEITVEVYALHLHYSTTYVVSKDLTLGVIKAEMADFLDCRQSELVLTVNGFPLGPDSLVYGMGAFASSTKQIICNRINEDDSFDYMEDIQ